jgi:glycosyltransferase involved in cell wall biosynthesis
MNDIPTQTRSGALLDRPLSNAQLLERRQVATRLSIVVPCYNEEEVLPETAKRLRELLQKLVGAGKITADSQVILVDDGSRDRSWEVIRELHGLDAHIRGVKLSGNRGHQTALMAGLFAAEGEAIVSIDADLQDDVAAIEKMVDEYRKGCDVVYGVRSSRTRDSVFKRGTAEWYYRIMALFGVKLVFNHADFRLLSRRAIEALKSYTEVNLFLRGIVPLIGYRTATVYYERGERFAGESKYPLSKMLAFAMDGITSFTAFPLRVIAFLGILVSMMSVVMIGYVLWIKLCTDQAVPGWASSVIPVYLLGGVQLLSIGILGEYVAKLYFEAKRRPRYFVEETL